MSILSALKQQSSSLDELAKLPQLMIMQMAQRNEIAKEMVAPILGRKAELMDAVARTKALQNQPQPSVMEQIMAKNAEAENPAPQMPPQMPQQAPQMAPQQVEMPQAMPDSGVSQLPIPERQYAGGGIVAFAGGGEADDDEDSDYMKSLYNTTMAKAIANARNAGTAGLSAISEAIKGVSSSIPPSYESAVAAQKMPVAVKPTSNHPYSDMVTRDAEKFGVDPRLSLHVLNKETGNIKNPETARSRAGAMGIAQFMPATAKQYGINPDIPEQASMGMNKHLKYLVDKYQDPKLAAIAYNWGEGNTNKWLKAGADPKKLPKETSNYVASIDFAEGGEVQSFAKGGQPEFGTPEYDELYGEPGSFKRMIQGISGYYQSPSSIAGFGRNLENTLNALGPIGSMEKIASKPVLGVIPMGATDKALGLGRAGLRANALDTTYRAAKSDLPEVARQSSNAQKRVEEQNTKINTAPNKFVYPSIEELTASIPSKEAPTVVTSEETAKPSQYDEFLKQIAMDREELGKQRIEDRNMALLSAGLGIMGGESPYAMANIGKGALSGVQYMSDANKQRAAQLANLNKLQATGLHYKDVSDVARAGMLSKEEKMQLANQKNIAMARDDYAQMAKQVEEGFLKKYPMAAYNPEDSKIIAAKKQWDAQYLPILENLRKLAYPNLPSTNDFAGYKIVK